ncbi:ribbon-helix-helix protein, CopG family [candidate division WOR-3 bacterium]|nr:ribbon-helix-helix protein, CopG family [candidate division WOR-3 bacterium]
MKNKTVNISFKKDLLKKIDDIAKEESRSRSELVREAARIYIDRKERWKKIFSYGDILNRDKGLSEADVEKEIEAYRKEQ